MSSALFPPSTLLARSAVMLRRGIRKNQVAISRFLVVAIVAVALATPLTLSVGAQPAVGVDKKLGRDYVAYRIQENLEWTEPNDTAESELSPPDNRDEIENVETSPSGTEDNLSVLEEEESLLPPNAKIVRMGSLAAKVAGVADFRAFPNLGIRRIIVTPLVALDNLEVIVQPLDGRPAGVPPIPGRKVYAYVDISTSVPNDLISEATVEFGIPRDWMDANRVQEDSVVLYHYGNSGWEPLPTSYEGDEAGEAVFSARTPGFSVFGYTYVQSEDESEGGTTGYAGAQADDGVYENIYEENYPPYIEVVTNGTFTGGTSGWQSVEVDSTGGDGDYYVWDSEEGSGSVHVHVQAEGGEPVENLTVYWYQSIGPFEAGRVLKLNGAFRKYLEKGEGLLRDGEITSATVRVDVRDGGSWVTVLENADIPPLGGGDNRDSGWVTFPENTYVVQTEVDNIRVWLDAEGRGSTGIFGYRENPTVIDLWADNISVKVQSFRMDVRQDITGIPTAHSYELQIEYYIAGDASENVMLYLENFASGSWDYIGNLGSTALDNFTYDLTGTDYVSGGEVHIRYVQPDNDAFRTILRIDYARVKYTILEPGKPELYLPENNAYTNDNTPYFEWTTGANAFSHRLVIDDDPNFADGENVYDNPSLGATENSIEIENQLPDGTYYWKVAAVTGAGENWSEVRKLIVDVTPPTAPVNQSPSNGENINDNTPVLDWTDSTDANPIVYCLYVDDDPNFSSVNYSFSELSTSRYEFTSELPEGVWYWRVCARDSSGNFSENSQATWFRVDVTKPAAPSAIWPENGESTNDDTPNLDWSPASEDSLPVLYRVYVDDDSGFTSVDFDSGWMLDDNFQVPTEMAEGIWYWRVQAKDNAGNVGDNTGTYWFRVDVTKPGIPSLLSPENNSSVAVSTPTFAWTAVEDDSGVTYELVVDNESGFDPSFHVYHATGIHLRERPHLGQLLLASPRDRQRRERWRMVRVVQVRDPAPRSPCTRESG